MSEAADKPDLYEIQCVVEKKRRSTEVADEFNFKHYGRPMNDRDIDCLMAAEAIFEAIRNDDRVLRYIRAKGLVA